MKRLAPGVYDDEQGGMHLDIAELLDASGYTDTPQNRETVLEAARDMARELGLPVTVVDDPVKPPTRIKGWRNYG